MPRWLKGLNSCPWRIKLLVCFIAFSMVSTLVVTWITAVKSNRTIGALARQTLLASSSQTARAVEGFISEAMDTVEMGAMLPALRNYLSLLPEERTAGDLAVVENSIWELLQSKAVGDSYSGRLSAMEVYWLLDQTGIVVVDSSSSHVGENYSSEDFFLIPIKYSQIYLSSIRFDHTGQPIFYLGKQVISSENQPVGVLVARYKADVFQRIIEANKDLAGNGSFAVLIDENGLRLGQGAVTESLYRYLKPLTENQMNELRLAGRIPYQESGEEAGSSVMPVELADLGKQLISAKDEALISFRLGEAQEVYQAVSTHLGIEQAPWQVLYVQSKRNFAYSEMVRESVLGAVLVILFTGIISIPLSKFLATPLKRLTTVAKAVVSGNLNARAVVETEDEFGELAKAFNQITSDLQQNLVGLEQQVIERTRDFEKRSIQLQAVAEIGRAAANTRNLDDLLSLVTRLISDRFGFYHVGIFMIEEQKRDDQILGEKTDRYAVLRATNSEGGQRMLARGHRLKVGQQGIVGYVTGTGNPRIALDVGEDPQFFNNPDLPATRSEMALALSISGRIIGALDVQSTQPGAFAREDIAVMQIMADLIAIALENARLFTESQEALEASRRVYAEISHKAWMEILASRSELSYTSLDYPYREVIEDGQISFENEEQTQENVESSPTYPLSLPIKVRDTIIGYLDTYKPKESGGWTPEEYDMVTTIIEQLGVALESARLYEASQAQAGRERLISEVASRMRESLDVDAVLRTAVQEIRHSLGLAQVEVRLRRSMNEG